MADSFYRGKCKTDAEIGTIVGPNAFGELLVCRSNGFVKSWWTATKEDLDAAKDRDPQSMIEFIWRKNTQ